MSSRVENLEPCLIYIDKEGRWYHEGVEMVRREFIRSFYRQMEMDRSGQYIIVWGGKRCTVDVEDTAFVVKRVDAMGKNEDETVGLTLHLSDDTDEQLAPDTLYMGEGNVLYCRVKEGHFPARFNRAAYYQLAAHVEEAGEEYLLSINGKKFKIESGGPETIDI